MSLLQSPPSRKRRAWGDAAQADALAVGLQARANQVALVVARVAAKFVESEGWKQLGYARQHDYVRERLGRSARWLRQLARVGRATCESPALADALVGAGGQEPLGIVKTCLVARVGRADDMHGWIALARTLDVRGLERAVREAEGLYAEPIDDTDNKSTFSVHAPRAVRQAFDEALELHRAVHGRSATVESFLESLVADAHAGGDARWIENPHLAHGVAALDDGFDATCTSTPDENKTTANREMAAEVGDAAPPCEFSEAIVASDPAMREAARLVDEASSLFARAGSGDAESLHGQLVDLARLEDRLQRMIGRLLLGMRRDRFFSRHRADCLPFDGVGSYARARLGMSAASAERLVRLARGAENHPVFGTAYDAGRIDSAKASLVVRLLGRGCRREAAWVAHATICTTRRLRDELSALRRSGSLDAGSGDVKPLDDPEWQRSLRREPGQSFRRIAELALQACDDSQPIRPVSVKIDEDLAAALDAAIDGAAAAVAAETAADGLGRETFSAAPMAVGFSTRETFSAASDQPLVPRWRGLMRMLLRFAATHDPPREAVRRRAKRVYERDGYRCAAPGCTARVELECHHVTYRSRGGADTPDNCTTLCQFHHQRGEHGGLLSVRGHAPLDLTFRIGRGATAVRYRNDRVVVV